MSYGSFFNRDHSLKRSQLKIWLKQSVMLNLGAQNSCWILLSSFGLLKNIYSHQPCWWIHIIIDRTHVHPQQRRKTAEQNAFFAQEWVSHWWRCQGCVRGLLVETETLKPETEAENEVLTIQAEARPTPRRLQSSRAGRGRGVPTPEALLRLETASRPKRQDRGHIPGRCVLASKNRLHRFDLSQSRSQNQRNLTPPPWQIMDPSLSQCPAFCNFNAAWWR